MAPMAPMAPMRPTEPMTTVAPVVNPFTVTQKPPVVISTRPANPCTEEVLRSSEIQAFADPLNRASYVVCTEIDVFVRMPCATGTFFDETIRHCVPEGWTAPICPVGLCKNEADCIIDEMKNEYKCLCRVGYTGLFCETNIDECAIEGDQLCRMAGGSCVDQLNAYYCDFGRTIGLPTQNAIEKPCTLLDLSYSKQFFEIPSPLGNVFLQCTGELTYTVSKCADMLFWNQELRTCTIERPERKTGMCVDLPCKNDGECVDLGQSFSCTCKPGWTGPLCEEEIDMCLTMPCGTGRCVSYQGGYNCVCENKIVDKFCGQILENPCLNPTPLGAEYYAYTLDMARFISCGLDRFAFVRDCGLGTVWEDSVNSCVAEVVAPKAPMMSLFDGAPMMPMREPVAPLRAVAPPMPMTTTMRTPVAPPMLMTTTMRTPVAPPMPMTTTMRPMLENTLPTLTIPTTTTLRTTTPLASPKFPNMPMTQEQWEMMLKQQQAYMQKNY
jgi:hypothetical protein